MIYLTTIATLFLGFYLREVLDTLKRLLVAVEALRGSQEPKKAEPASFSEPMTRAEMVAQLEDEKIRLLNG